MNLDRKDLVASSPAEAARMLSEAIRQSRVYTVQMSREARCGACRRRGELRFGYCFACVAPHLPGARAQGRKVAP